MAKEKTEDVVDDNAFEGFNILKDHSAPEKVVKKKPEEKVVEDIDVDDKAIKALEEAEKEIKDIASKKEKKEEVVEEEAEEVVPEEEASSFKTFASFLKEEGVVDFEDDEFEDSTEGLKKIVEKTAIKMNDEWKNSYDEDTKKYLEFIENGGKPSDFHKYYYNDSSFQDFNIDNEDNQKHAIREGLRLSGWEDDAEIEDEIALYEDAGKLQSKAKAHLSRLQKAEKENKDMLLEVQKNYAKEQDTIRKKEWDEFRKGLMDSETISGFVFNKKTKDDLWDYMTSVNKKTGTTKYQDDSKEKGNQVKYMFAYLLKNNWDVSTLTKDIKNKVVGDVKKKLSNYTDSRAKIKSGTPAQQDKEENISFAGFKNYLKS